MLHVVKPRPSAWDGWCNHTDGSHDPKWVTFVSVPDEGGEVDPFCPLCECTGYKTKGRMFARWSHEWAAVVWLCLSVTAGANQHDHDGSMIPLRVLEHMALNEYRVAIGLDELERSVWL